MKKLSQMREIISLKEKAKKDDNFLTVFTCVLFIKIINVFFLFFYLLLCRTHIHTHKIHMQQSN